MLVVDASVMVMLATGEPGSEEADRMVEGAVLAAPELVLAEAANALWRKARVGSITRAEAVEAAKGIGPMLARLVPLRVLQDQALDLALRRDHPAYDCFYVALAMREAAPLLTADRRLAQRFGGDVEVRLPTA
jgi:predicted nucleic acid-binding protein